MTTLPEQLSAAGKTQLATQIEFFQKLTAQAFDSAERMLALNLNASRSTIEQSSSAVRQLMAVRDPRDLLALGAQTQQHVQSVMAYSRQLFDIASSVAQPALAAATRPENVVATARPVLDVREAQAAPQAAAEPVHNSGILPRKHPLGEAEPEAAPAIAAKPTAIAQAVSAVTEAPADVPHPAASPVPASGPIDIPPVKPVEAAPPPAPTSGAAPVRAKKADATRAPKASRKR